MSILHGKQTLAPCPFCGRTVWAVARAQKTEYVFCCNCKARGPMVRAAEYRDDPNESSPEDCWNRRTDPRSPL